MKKRGLVFGVFLFAILIIGFVVLQKGYFVSAQTTSTVCAVHSSQGWCQDVLPSQADPNYPTYSVSCSQGPGECAIGTCVNTKTGTCLQSPVITCPTSDGGQFYSTSISNTPVCQQGCCIIGTSSSLTTQAHCDAEAPNYPGAQETFRSDVTNEIQCLMLANPNETGACVYDTGKGKTCKFTTKSDCSSIEKTSSSATFYKNYLCTNQNLHNLGVNCTKTKMTECLTGYDQVYFQDSCGNRANIYWAGEYTDANYWNYVAGTNNVPLPPAVNINSGSSTDPSSVANDGNCDSFSGSTCSAYNKAIDLTGATYGTNVCRNLNCVSGPFVQQFKNDPKLGDGRTPVNGESWCARTDPSDPTKIIFGDNTGLTGSSDGSSLLVSSLSKTQNLPGSSDYVMGCYNGQITTTLCDNTRNKICSQTGNSSTVFNGVCTLNQWSSCYTQNSSSACNSAGNCQWVIGASILRDKNGTLLVYDNSTGDLVQMVDKKGSGGIIAGQGNKPDGIDDKGRPGAACVPKYAPGFSVSADSSQKAQASAVQICNIASTNCFVNFTRSAASSLLYSNFPTKGWKIDASSITCLNNDGNLTNATGWVTNFTNMCFALGDCGVSLNYIGKKGSNTQSDMFKIFGNLTAS